jgi:hypothetical protein
MVFPAIDGSQGWDS